MALPALSSQLDAARTAMIVYLLEHPSATDDGGGDDNTNNDDDNDNNNTDKINDNEQDIDDDDHYKTLFDGDVHGTLVVIDKLY